MSKFLNYIKEHYQGVIILLAVLFPLALSGIFIGVGNLGDDGKISITGETPTGVQEATEDMLCEIQEHAKTTVAGLAGIDTPQDASSGCDPTELEQMGSMPYYKVDVSTPTAFYNAVNGKGFNEGYGYQCVAGFKEFMYALSGKYVATSTGGASGYAYQQSQIEPLGFTWHAGSSGLQNGDWGIFNSGTYGHVAMYYNGQWFGQNQGAANSSVGNAFNLISLSTSPVGYYRPNIYATQANNNTSSNKNNSTSGSTSSITTSTSYVVVRGDTLGQIALNQGWWSSANGLFGDTGYAQQLADKNGILNRGLIYPGQTINKAD